MKKKLTLLSSITIFVSILGLISLIVFFIYHCFIPIKENDINQYLETDGRKSSYVFFPDSIDSNYEVIEYHYYDYRLINGSEIILSLKYDDASFEDEFDRLSLLKFHFFEEDSPHALAIDENKELFNYYTFVAEYQPKSKQFEYACFDFDNKIVHYIRLDYIDIEYISIAPSLLPKYYFDDSLSKYEYNIYQYPFLNNWL